MGKMFSPIVTVPITVAESFSHHTSDQTQLIEEGSLQRAVSSSQAMKIPLPPPPTPTCSLTTVSALSHQAATPPVVNSSHNHPNSAVALPNTVYTMQTESVSPEEAGEAFREYRADLLEVVVDPLILANHLYSKKIISRETLKQITELSLTVSNKTFVLLDAVEARIRTHSSDFLSLLAILGNDAHLCVYAERLWNSYCEYSYL